MIHGPDHCHASGLHEQPGLLETGGPRKNAPSVKTGHDTSSLSLDKPAPDTGFKEYENKEELQLFTFTHQYYILLHLLLKHFIYCRGGNAAIPLLVKGLAFSLSGCHLTVLCCLALVKVIYAFPIHEVGPSPPPSCDGGRFLCCHLLYTCTSTYWKVLYSHFPSGIEKTL